MSESDLFTNRELSWLEFNERILDQARDKNIPLLERLKFLSISSSNLDEFFMVRVGGLQLLDMEQNQRKDPSGLTPAQQLKTICTRVRKMVENQYKCYLNHLEGDLAKSQIKRIRPAELTSEQNHYIETVFMNEIFPTLSSIAISTETTLPLLANRILHIGVSLAGKEEASEAQRYAVIPIGKNMSRFITLPSASGYRFMLIEDVIFLFAGLFFPGESITECVPFRITRNADLSVREDYASDLLTEMEAVIDARKRSACVRLEIADHASSEIINFFTNIFNIEKCWTFLLPGPLDLSSFMKLNDLNGYPDLKYIPWQPQQSPDIIPGEKMFDLISKKSILLCHPYQSFEPVLRFIEEAANDPDVITIKQILYRTSRNSPIVSSLIKAANKGKYVTAIVELKARFDEERNIEWAKELEDAGVQVLYGVKNLKTHAKVCLVIRREPQGLVRYMHLGTGNYNEITAHLYSDISFLTNDEDIGADISAFFNAITGYSQPMRFRKIDMAPIGLRDTIIELIENETERKKQGHKALIRAKMNSLVDPLVIKALYEASKAGVKIELNIRGICCLKADVPGISENISVVSIVDRYLEHSRIFYFYHGGEEKIFTSTADWMPRNLDKRIELLIPVEESNAKNQLINILDIYFKDTVNAWKLNPSGDYTRVKISGKKKPLRSQEFLYQNACTLNLFAKKLNRTRFEPHKPNKT
jgi:polyphosphate kinase